MATGHLGTWPNPAKYRRALADEVQRILARDAEGILRTHLDEMTIAEARKVFDPSRPRKMQKWERDAVDLLGTMP